MSCINIRSEDGRITPLLMAAKFGFAEIVKYLVKKQHLGIFMEMGMIFRAFPYFFFSGH